jgi:hypothetical protein
MRPRLPPSTSRPPFWSSLQRFVRDVPYVVATIGQVVFYHWPSID